MYVIRKIGCTYKLRGFRLLTSDWTCSVGRSWTELLSFILLLSSLSPKLLLCFPTSPSFPPSIPPRPVTSFFFPLLVRLVFWLLRSFSGVLLWSAWTAGEPLTAACVCVCAVWVGCLHSSFSFIFFDFHIFLRLLLITLPWPPSSSSFFHLNSFTVFAPYQFLCRAHQSFCVFWLRSRCSWKRPTCDGFLSKNGWFLIWKAALKI